MKIIKLDRRFANYPKYLYAIGYSKIELWNGISGRPIETVLREELTRNYGTDVIWLPGTGFKRQFNDDWFQNRAKRRFYIKDEAMITHIMLLLS